MVLLVKRIYFNWPIEASLNARNTNLFKIDTVILSGYMATYRLFNRFVMNGRT